MTRADDLIDALEPVVHVFCELGVRHFIGGSIASSFHGATRSTMDVDVVCDLTEAQAAPFVSRFTGEFYVSQTAVESAVRNKSCFNLIHLPTAFKVDVFISRERPFDIDSMRRATPGKTRYKQNLGSADRDCGRLDRQQTGEVSPYR